MSNLKVEWQDAKRKPRRTPNPDYPNGVDVDCSDGNATTCSTPLPYPAPGVGVHIITCPDCGLYGMITAAARRDDPRSAKFACKKPRANP